MQLPKIKCNLFCASAVLLVLAGIWVTYAPIAKDPDRFSSVHHSVKEITGIDVGRMIGQPVGQQTLVYAYASWCEICLRSTPVLVDKIRRGELEGIRVIAVAWDEDAFKLTHHLVTEGFDGVWTPYMSSEKLGSSLMLFGASEIPGVPYIALFDEAGYIRKEHFGLFTSRDLDNLLGKRSAPMSTP
jgi:hypothetical protein